MFLSHDRVKILEWLLVLTFCVCLTTSLNCLSNVSIPFLQTWTRHDPQIVMVTVSCLNTNVLTTVSNKLLFMSHCDLFSLKISELFLLTSVYQRLPGSPLNPDKSSIKSVQRLYHWWYDGWKYEPFLWVIKVSRHEKGLKVEQMW